MVDLQHPWLENRPKSPWLPPGFSRVNKRGATKTSKPIIDLGKCTKCGICWIFCPEGVISRVNMAVDYDYCTGCGICAEECPLKVITMKRED
ncbi:MAG: 4Fe-4S binding protein [Candidatus Bathyarchaeia archaeon]